MPSTTEIANMALGHIGVSNFIANLESEKSEEAAICRRFLAIAREATLRDFDWPFATRIQTLDLVAETPNDEWDFSYRQPAKCLNFRRILSGTRRDTAESKIPYRLAQDDTGILILTDKRDAQGEFTAREEDPGKYPPDFTLVLSWRLAMYIASGLEEVDQSRAGVKASQMYEMELVRARANAANEEESDRPPEAPYIGARR